MKRPIVTICSSANFYKKAVEIQAELERAGFQAIVPITAEKMKISGDYDASHYRTWLKDAKDYHKKSALMRQHFREIEKADAVLVINQTKHGIKHYIGGNVLLEMGLAFWLEKPIFILYEVPEESNFLEEIIAMKPFVLHGQLAALVKHLQKPSQP